MKLTVRPLRQAALIIVDGEVDTTNSAEWEKGIDGARRRLSDHLIFDVTGLSFLDSSGLSVLLAAAVLAEAHGARVHLAGLQPRVARLLELTGTVRVMSIHDHVDQALAAVERVRGPASIEPA
ncbi:STAS domain-containing protein [Nonomuraea sp. NN258]|uniref:STAS domain-containing protein n=1 Tax=Nonomuraea antri TaxID=2730852 RepID=UPI0015681330|nr:STAS domain-containing protein [Nonomuraea antri]NRQ33916.1 STAS domain-containing protein [Nonomuraea antri]